MLEEKPNLLVKSLKEVLEDVRSGSHVLSERPLIESYRDVDEKADQKILQRSTPSLRPIFGEDEIEFLKRHGMLNSLLVGHEKFIKQGESRVGHLIVTIPELLQETGIMNGAVTTHRPIKRMQNLANCPAIQGQLSARNACREEEAIVPLLRQNLLQSNDIQNKKNC